MARKLKMGRNTKRGERSAGREKRPMATGQQEKGDELLWLTSHFKNIEPCDKLCVAQHAQGLQFEYANN